MMDVFQFGEGLLRTGDLDPVYVAIYRARMPRTTLERFLLGYWAFYHCGTAAWIAEQPTGFWERFRTAAGSKDYPRCHERRHFRGENARKSTEDLAGRGMDSLFRPLQGELTAGEVFQVVRSWYGFGPWIAFKVADMLERLNLARVSFDVSTIQLFDSPAEGADLLWQDLGRGEKPANLVPWAVGEILDRLGDWDAPPRDERKINIQEAETILCKWKSYRKGHYTIGEDVAGLRKSLLRFSRCKLSQQLIRGMREEGLW